MRPVLILTIVLMTGLTSMNAQKTKILFIGNSYTYVNNLPAAVYQLALSLGDTVFYDSYAPGGYRLMNHASDVNCMLKINSDDWDFVVVQAQSQEPSWPPSQVSVEVYPYAQQINDSIKANNTCSETIFFMSWGRKYGDASNCTTWPPVCTYLGMQERLMAGYMTMAEMTGATVAPVGLAWKNSMDLDTDSLIDLYSADFSHPSVKGTYLTACVMYGTMFHKSPIGAMWPGGLTQAEAEFLQHVADSTVFSDDYNFYFDDTYTSTVYDLSWESWYENGNIAIAGFDYTDIQGQVSFSDQSLNAGTWNWDFGTGDTSVMQNPQYTYAGNGSYIVTQIVENSCFSDTISDTLIIYVTNVTINSNDLICNIYPNPNTGRFNLAAPGSQDLSYELTDCLGRILEMGEIDSGNPEIVLSVSEKGSYLLRIKVNDSIITKKVFVE